MSTSANLVARILQTKESSSYLKSLVTGLSIALDRASGLCMFAIMALVVTNVISRAVFNKAILGTYEYVGYLTAVMIAFSLANCAVKKSHIAVDFIIERLPVRSQAVIDIVTNGLALCFWNLATWHLGMHAYNLSLRGVVSPTTQTPFYYFIYLVAFGVFALGLVILVNLCESIGKATNSR